jgi:ABC-2 type transport system permease protein
LRLAPAGSTLWLLGHELRLAWRGRRSAKAGRAAWVAPALIVGFGAFLALTAGLGLLTAARGGYVQVTPAFAFGVDAGLALLFSLMLSSTLAAAANAFYERGDLDLLLSAPVPPRRVLTVRCLGMAATAASLWVYLAAPVVLPSIVTGDVRWLTVFPVLIGMALAATALGLLIAFGLFRMIGPRATRTLAQVLAAFIGAGFFLTAQARNFVPRSRLDALGERVSDFASSGAFEPDQPLALPARALTGDAAPALALFAAALLLFAVVTTSVGRTFARDAAAAAGAGLRRVRAAKGGVKGFEGGPFGAMVRKELRLIRRDPALLSQVLLRVLYLLPLGFIAFRNASSRSDLLVAGSAAALVFVTGQLASSFAWITVSAEDAPQLLAAAPARPGELRRAKITAALIPVAVLLVGPLAALTWAAPWAGAASAVVCAAMAVSSGLLAVWYERPAKRTDIRRRRSGGSWAGAIAEVLISLAWAGAAWLAVAHLAPWALLPAGAAVVMLIAFRRPERSFAEVLKAAA